MSTIYAVVDCARDDQIYDLVHDALFAMSLFRAEVVSPLGRATPYLLPLEKAEQLMAAWREYGIGRSWGLFLTSSQTQAKVLQRLRTFNVARLPDGRVVLFRWWDPRVFRAYLPTCNREELNALFASVENYICENENGTDFTIYSNQDGLLATKRVDRWDGFEVSA